MASERRGLTGYADDDPRSKLTFPMDTSAIMECIPHRHPFVLIDRVLKRYRINISLRLRLFLTVIRH